MNEYEKPKERGAEMGVKIAAWKWNTFTQRWELDMMWITATHIETCVVARDLEGDRPDDH